MAPLETEVLSNRGVAPSAGCAANASTTYTPDDNLSLMLLLLLLTRRKPRNRAVTGGSRGVGESDKGAYTDDKQSND